MSSLGREQPDDAILVRLRGDDGSSASASASASARGRVLCSPHDVRQTNGNLARDVLAALGKRPGARDWPCSPMRGVEAAQKWVAGLHVVDLVILDAERYAVAELEWLARVIAGGSSRLVLVTASARGRRRLEAAAARWRASLARAQDAQRDQPSPGATCYRPEDDVVLAIARGCARSNEIGQIALAVAQRAYEKMAKRQHDSASARLARVVELIVDGHEVAGLDTRAWRVLGVRLALLYYGFDCEVTFTDRAPQLVAREPATSRVARTVNLGQAGAWALEPTDLDVDLLRCVTIGHLASNRDGTVDVAGYRFEGAAAFALRAIGRRTHRRGDALLPGSLSEWAGPSSGSGPAALVRLELHDLKDDSLERDHRQTELRLVYRMLENAPRAVYVPASEHHAAKTLAARCAAYFSEEDSRIAPTRLLLFSQLRTPRDVHAYAIAEFEMHRVHWPAAPL